MRTYYIRRDPAKQVAFPNGDTSYKSKNLWGSQKEMTAPTDRGRGITILRAPSARACGTEATSREANSCITLHAAAAFFCSYDHLTSARDNVDILCTFRSHTDTPFLSFIMFPLFRLYMCICAFRLDGRRTPKVPY